MWRGYLPFINVCFSPKMNSSLKALANHSVSPAVVYFPKGHANFNHSPSINIYRMNSLQDLPRFCTNHCLLLHAADRRCEDPSDFTGSPHVQWHGSDWCVFTLTIK